MAETLAEYRGNHRYNFLDDNLRRFNAEVPMMAQWDDHEVVNNWYWEKRLDDDARYSEKSVAVLAAHAQRAFREYMPLSGGLDLPMQLSRRFSFGPRLDLFRVDMRSYRGPNGDNRQARLDPDSAFLGSAQIEWLKGALKESRRRPGRSSPPTCRSVCWSTTMPRTKTGCEAVANGDDGPPLGRELEIADLLAFIKRENIRNVHWITADVHYAATHRYDPNHAQFTEFLPFYEFVSGPLCAGGFGPNVLDKTFGPSVVFQHVPPAGRSDLAPSEGSCHFGHVRIDGKSGAHDGDPPRRRRRHPARDRSAAGLSSLDRGPPGSAHDSSDRATPVALGLMSATGVARSDERPGVRGQMLSSSGRSPARSRGSARDRRPSGRSP